MNKNMVRWILTGSFVLVLLVAIVWGIFTNTLDQDFKTIFIAGLSSVMAYYFGYKMNDKGDDNEEDTEAKG